MSSIFELVCLSAKKLGNAVMRNQIKRRIRHILIEHKDQLVENVDFVVIARKGVEILDYAEMEKNLLHVLKLSKIYQEGNGSEKKLQLTSLMVLALFVMSACTASGTPSEINSGINRFLE